MLPTFFPNTVMKFSFFCVAIFLLSGCSLGVSNEIKKAESLLSQFECKNVNTNAINHSAITSYHEKSLNSSKQKVTTYISDYKAGQVLFDMPLPDIVQQQYLLYRDACQSLGGLDPNKSIDQ